MEPFMNTTSELALQALAFACCTLGHIFSPWLSFKGGKGIAVAFGCLLPILGPLPWILEFMLFLILAVARRLNGAWQRNIGKIACVGVLELNVTRNFTAARPHVHLMPLTCQNRSKRTAPRTRANNSTFHNKLLVLALFRAHGKWFLGTVQQARDVATMRPYNRQRSYAKKANYPQVAWENSSSHKGARQCSSTRSKLHSGVLQS